MRYVVPPPVSCVRGRCSRPANAANAASAAAAGHVRASSNGEEEGQQKLPQIQNITPHGVKLRRREAAATAAVLAFQACGWEAAAAAGEESWRCASGINYCF